MIAHRRSSMDKTDRMDSMDVVSVEDEVWDDNHSRDDDGNL